jgi:hypothetical protein
MTIGAQARTGLHMTETELHTKLDEIDRLLNDPDISLEPARVWSLLAEVAKHDAGQASAAG